MIVHYNDFDLYFDTVFDTSLFDIDSSLPAIYDEASFTSNIERSSVAVTTKTCKLLQSTFILILTSLILVIVLIHILILSLVDVYSSMIYGVYQGSMVLYKNGFHPLNGDSPE